MPLTVAATTSGVLAAAVIASKMPASSGSVSARRTPAGLAVMGSPVAVAGGWGCRAGPGGSGRRRRGSRSPNRAVAAQVGVGVVEGFAGAAAAKRCLPVGAEHRGDGGVLALVVDEATAAVPGQPVPSRADDVHGAGGVPVALVGGAVRIHHRLAVVDDHDRDRLAGGSGRGGQDDADRPGQPFVVVVDR